MAGNNIAITISAVDNASARMEAISKRIAAMSAPVQKLQKSFARFGDASGITKLSKGFGDLSRGSLDAFRNIARVVDPLAAITGAASIAGMVKLTQSWADFGSQLGFSAQRLGMSSSTLQIFQGGAMLAGASASSLTSGIKTLRDGLWNAAGGRNPALVATMAYMGFTMGDVTKASKNLTAYLPQFADKIAAIKDPSAQAAVATALFGGAAEDLLPWLRQGSKGMAEYNAMAARYGVMNAAGTTAANNLRMAQVGLTLAVQGLGNSIAQSLAPVLDPLLNQMSEWIAANRTWIAQDIGKAVQQFATWLMKVNWTQVGNGIASVGAAIGACVKALGGWGPAARDVLLFIGGAWLAGMLAPIASIALAIAGITASFAGLPILAGAAALGAVVALAPSMTGATATGSYNGKHFIPTTGVIPETTGGMVRNPTSGRMQYEQSPSAQATVRTEGMNYFMGQGWSKAHAAALMGNVQAESSFDPTARNSQGNAGLFQWDAKRAAAIFAGTGIDIYKASAAQQFQAAQWELMHPEKAAALALHNSPDAASGAVAVDNGFERSGDPYSAQMSRGANAAYINTLATGPTTNITHAPAAGPITNIANTTRGGPVTHIANMARTFATNIANTTHTGPTTNITHAPAAGPITNIANTAPAGPITNIANTIPAGPPANIGDGGAVPAPVPAAGGDPGAAAGVSPGLAKVLIEVQHMNVPRGVTMKATSNSPNATIGRLKIVRAMEGHA